MHPNSITNQNTVESMKTVVTCGVPQGSILGPILFALYVNDMASCIPEAKFVLFADDTTVIFKAKTITELNMVCSHGINKLHDWLCTNRLSLNIGKTQCLLFGSKNMQNDLANFNISLGQDKIKVVHEAKYLGLILDDQLSWSHHINSVCKKINFSCFVLQRSKALIDRKTKIMLYYSLIYPYLYYCVEHWSSATKKNLDKLNKLQNKSLCIINCVKRRSHCTLLYKNCKILKFADVANLKCITYMHDVHLKNVPQQILKIFPKRYSLFRRRLRHDNNFITKEHRLKIKGDSLLIRGPKLWNSMNASLKTCKSRKTIKKIL